jgi:hypothetical protein
MPVFGNGGFQIEVPDVDFNAAVATQVSAEMAPILASLETTVTTLAQQALSGSTPPEWWEGSTGGGSLNYKMVNLGAPLTVSSTSFVNVLSTTFQLQSATSKVLAIGRYGIGQSGPNICHVSLFRDSTNLAPSGLTILDWIREPNVDIGDIITPHGFMILDEPASTNQVTYTIKSYVSQNTSYFGRRHNNNGGSDVMPPGATLFLLELPV